ncbi:MAG: ADP-dependent glucokinase/phosphofructokinase, partial [Limnochordia bacterium]
MFETIWQRRVQGAVAEPVHGRVLAAYNTNVDAIVHVTPEKLTKWLAEAPELDWNRVEEGSIGDVKTIVTLEDFFIVLFDRLAKGKSFHIVLQGEEIVDWLQRVVGAEKESMGGQAGIVANQMAYLGADALCYTSLLSSQQAALFHEKVKVPVVEDGQLKILPAPAAAKDRLTKINWILEYAKDEVFTVGSREIVTPRANRVILATRPKEAIMGFQEDMV